ncbi:FmdB family zinc ribbon protein [Stackebrandtia nassauensis]|uniref:Regulatory protein, FmdB family n=1 Tax=Stackebrandtia nassauensis (strain DSM 44728 / CIP 108903 / NRRL B-16338 / NBRC 102104 / LLR-40K-21) TaxID=446470 RepID=D3Q457_STANL|nr:FmdB family zinc ribbon protein [Stackebrandtia nassauensis]ADD45942.1 regulatory protein, FmdB family [Stackebrandtia nassauensis DSM 44728]
MPTYQYVCTKCGHDLEARQSFTDKALTDCPSCGIDGALRKQFGSVGVVFKGSGFYRTDSRTGSGKELAKNDSKPAKAASESKSEAKSESKPKTETKKADKPKAASSTS